MPVNVVIEPIKIFKKEEVLECLIKQGGRGSGFEFALQIYVESSLNLLDFAHLVM